jgi:hypothetical protein
MGRWGKGEATKKNEMKTHNYGNGDDTTIYIPSFNIKSEHATRANYKIRKQKSIKSQNKSQISSYKLPCSRKNCGRDGRQDSRGGSQDHGRRH